MNQNDAVMWTEKYRPKTLDEIVNLKDVVESLKAFLRKPATMPHLLFAGRPGTGKTTIALCIAKQLLGVSWRSFALELNASDERGIKMVRERVKTFSRYSRGSLASIPYALVILDECDQMTSSAQTALRRIMETSSHTCRFILICNYSSKIIEPIQSRCAIFRFSTLKQEDVVKHLKYVAEMEHINLHSNAAKTIVEFSEGDLRRAINILQTSAVYEDGKMINEKTVLRVVGRASPKQIQLMLNKALSGKLTDARNMLYELMTTYGFSGVDIIRQMHRELFRLQHLSQKEKAELIGVFGEYDFRLSEGANEDIQLSALLAQLTRFSESRGNSANG
jgi:replication factor C small subunit